MPRLLVLSAHDVLLDRRIVAQVNTLVESGRDVTLLSVPTEIPEGCVNARVVVIMPTVLHPVASRWSAAKQLLRWTGLGLSDFVRGTWYGRGQGPAPAWTKFFVQHAPAGPFDAVICHDLTTLPAGAELRKRWPAARLIYDSHELFPCQFADRRIEAYWTEIEAKFIPEADLVITVNQSIARELATRYDIRMPQVIYNSDGVESNATKIDRADFLRYFGAADGFRVLFQGHLDVGRNLQALVQAFVELQSEARLFLLGGGPVEAELRELVGRLGLRNVYFGRAVPQGQLRAYTSHADIGMIPYVAGSTLNTLYCTPNKLFEYIEACVPICASDLPELSGIVRGHGIGDVYDMGSPRNIARAILDCKSRLAAGEFSRDRLLAARAAFSWRTQADRLVAMFQSLGV